MNQPPKWFLPVAIVALLWNLMGCAAYLMDVMTSAEDVAAMGAAQQALRSSRPAWSVAGTAIAVWLGAAGSLGLILRKSWATPLLFASLAGVIIQDVWFLSVRQEVSQFDPTAIWLQCAVLLIAIGLVMLARTASQRGWLAPKPA